MSKTEDTKSPVEALKEVAAALNREASPIADAQKREAYERAKQAADLNRLADSLNRISKGLRWIDRTSLWWIAKPLRRTATALMKLTPAELAETDAKEALKVTADALDKASGAVAACAMIINDPKASGKLENIWESMPERYKNRRVLMPVGGHLAMHLISSILKNTADAVRNADPEEIANVSYYIEGVATATKEVMDHWTDPNA